MMFMETSGSGTGHHSVSARRAQAVANLTGVRDTTIADDLIFEIQRHFAIADQQLQQTRDIARKHLARVHWNGAWQIDWPDDGHAMRDDGLARLCERTVATRLGGDVDDDGAGRHRCDH